MGHLSSRFRLFTLLATLAIGLTAAPSARAGILSSPNHPFGGLIKWNPMFPGQAAALPQTHLILRTAYGAGDVQLTNFRVNTPHFQINNEPVTLFSEGSGEDILIYFNPTSPGLKQDTLYIEHNATNIESPLKFPLQGLAKDRNITPDLEPDVDEDDEANLFFDEVPVGQNSDDDDNNQYVTVYDPRDGDLVRVTSVSITGEDAGDFSLRLYNDANSNVFGSNLSDQVPLLTDDLSNEYGVQIEVRFAPSGEGERTAQLKIFHSGTAPSPLIVNLTGEGILPPSLTLKLGQEYVIRETGGEQVFTSEGEVIPPETPSFGAPGDTISVPLTLETDEYIGVGGMQFQVIQSNPGHQAEFLRFEVDLESFSGGFSPEPGPENENNGFKAVTSLSGDTIRVVIYSPKGSAIYIYPEDFSAKPNVRTRSTEGPVDLYFNGSAPIGHFFFKLNDDDDDGAHLGDTYHLDLEEALISDSEGDSPEESGLATLADDDDARIQVGIHGDLSLDGQINVFDIVRFVRILVEKDVFPDVGSTAYIIADANADGFLLVNDVIHQARIILGINFNNLTKPVADGPQRPVAVSLGATQGLDDGSLAIPVYMEADGMVSGAQMTFTFDPSKLSVGAPLLTGRASGMSIDSHVKDGVLKVVFYSVQLNGGIAAGAGPVLLVPVTLRDGASDPTMALSNVVLANPRAGRTEVSVPTGSVRVSALPTAFRLGSNRPNPFNPTTQIAYEVPQPAHVTIAVYNLLGQEVVRLVDGVQAAGRYNVVWNGRNGLGASVASGVYLYRMTTSAGYSETRRMTLLK